MKCKECAYLNMNVKSSIGYRCEQTVRPWKSKTAMYKYAHTPACSAFKPKESPKDIKQITAKMKRGEPITGKELREFLERKGVRE